jgi:enoyl-CoA hydratase
MSYENILVETANGIATISINRPKALNALNQDVLSELIAAFTAASGNAEVKGVIVTGAGDKAFVAGADIASMKTMTPMEADRFCQLGHRAMRLIETFEKPVIAAVNGFALGGGCELALSCDFIYASKTAKFGLPEVNLGIFPGFGGTQRLMRLVGRNAAKELIYTADIIGADDAKAIGLVNKVTEPDQLLATAQAAMKKIFTKGPVAVKLSKRLLNEGCDLPLASGLALEQAQFPLVFASEDRVEGVSAFLEKRPAAFKGQ